LHVSFFSLSVAYSQLNETIVTDSETGYSFYGLVFGGICPGLVFEGIAIIELFVIG